MFAIYKLYFLAILGKKGIAHINYYKLRMGEHNV